MKQDTMRCSTSRKRGQRRSANLSDLTARRLPHYQGRRGLPCPHCMESRGKGQSRSLGVSMLVYSRACMWLREGTHTHFLGTRDEGGKNGSSRKEREGESRRLATEGAERSACRRVLMWEHTTPRTPAFTVILTSGALGMIDAITAPIRTGVWLFT